MKIKLISLVFCFFAFVTVAASQSSIKLFDAVPIGLSDGNIIAASSPYGSYREAEVYLSCPTGIAPSANVSGPNGGKFVADDFLTVNDSRFCPIGLCFGAPMNDPMYQIGLPVDVSYTGVDAVDVSRVVTGTGLYKFNIIDWGYTYGNSEVYLNTSCTIIPVNTPPAGPTGPTTICHRNNGNRGPQTITVGPNALAAHLAHGDTSGACGQ